ncbi:MAG: hypothetical protein AAF656_06290 [Planctomycetota bacterium]
MPVYQVPDDAGPFVVVTSKGEFAVADIAAAELGTQAAKLGLLFIPCRDEHQAEALAEQLNAGEHDGAVQVDLLG